MEYCVRIVAWAVFGAVAYIASWLLFAFAWRWWAVMGGAMMGVVVQHVVHAIVRTVRDAS